MKVQLDLAQEEVDNLVNQVTEAETNMTPTRRVYRV